MSGWRCGLGLLLVTACSSVVSQPLQVVNNNPVTALYGVPGHREAAPLTAGQWGMDLQGTVSNHFADASRGGTSVSFDGESTRIDLRLRYALSDRLELQVDLPWLRHQGGRLDGLIEDWHDVFGLPNGDRDTVDEDQLLYRYSN